MQPPCPSLIRAFDDSDTPRCETILRALPDWFGIEESLQMYVRDTQRYPTAIAEHAGEAVGFVTWRRHFPESAEIHCLAVLKQLHRRGIGRQLVEHVAATVRSAGARVLQVKTLGPSRPDANYARTRAFYFGLGFVPLEEFPDLWPGNPCLILVRSLD